MKEVWLNLLRRRLRTFLTVLGVTVGTLAFTVMGAMSEKINLLVDGAFKYYGTRIIVQSKASVPGQFLGPPMSIDLVDQIRGIPGVDMAFPNVYMLYQEADEPTASSFGFPPITIGVDPERFSYQGDRYPVVLSRGRFFGPGDRGVVVLGVDLARFKGVDLGDTLKVRGSDFRVIGITDRTLTARDSIAFIPLRDAQEIFARSIPPPLNENPYSLASEIEVFPSDIGQADAVAARITQQIDGASAHPPGDIEDQFRQNLVIFNVIIVGSAVIAVVVGGLSVLNTMAMAVSERTREIGIRKAIGATDGDIVREFLQESALMGLVGGLLGLGAGALMVWIINDITADQGVVVFAVTLRLGVVVPLFATALGAAAGLLPAINAARRNPVDTLRAE